MYRVIAMEKTGRGADAATLLATVATADEAEDLAFKTLTESTRVIDGIKVIDGDGLEYCVGTADFAFECTRCEAEPGNIRAGAVAWYVWTDTDSRPYCTHECAQHGANENTAPLAETLDDLEVDAHVHEEIMDAVTAAGIAYPLVTQAEALRLIWGSHMDDNGEILAERVQEYLPVWLMRDAEAR